MKETFIPGPEIESRIARFSALLGLAGLDGALLPDYTDLLYFTGTIQNGVLFVPARGTPVLFVRRSLERAQEESPLSDILPYTSFREVAAILKSRNLPLGGLGIDESRIVLSTSLLLRKNFPESRFADCGLQLRKTRAVKSAYEIDKLKKAGETSRTVTTQIPSLLREGISEWELALELFHRSALAGRSCITRIAPGLGEFLIGYVNFGDHSNRPTAFDGPGGLPGLSPACPYAGSDRKLRKGDLVFVDCTYPFEEYYVDKTRIYSFGARPSAAVLEAHARCLEIQGAVASRLRPGKAPSAIFDEVYAEAITPHGFDGNFMGYGSNKVKFLGHGIGMMINEYPVIAKKFDEPLEENMVLAVEPKKGIDGIGMVGIENTFVVRPEGGLCLTADDDGIVVV